MSNRTLSIDDRVHDDMLSVSLEESELLSDLCAEAVNMKTNGDDLTLVCNSC